MKQWVYSFNANEAAAAKAAAFLINSEGLLANCLDPSVSALHEAAGSSHRLEKNKFLLGSKGAALKEMTRLGLPVPAGFTITTEVCNYYWQNNHTLPSSLAAEIKAEITSLERATGKIFGDSANPLLLSVRSGAAISMPGMMDTVLNLGMNDEVVACLIKQTGNKLFVLDSYRRFLAMYGEVALGLHSCLFQEASQLEDGRVTLENLEKTIASYKQLIARHSKLGVPGDPDEQLYSAIAAVIKSWNSERAQVYRRLNNISDELGTAVNIQAMVFGNKGDDSATGVVFSRCPASGENKLFGEFLLNAQGEDVVSGTRTPLPIDQMQQALPQNFKELTTICKELELYYRDIQDIEFTIENKKLYILQTRSAKRTAASAIKVAVDMAGEGLISKDEAIMRIPLESINKLLHMSIDYSHDLPTIAQGLPASPGAATGMAVFHPRDAEEMSRHHKVILVRADTSPEDIQGMYVASGILTSRGGMTSHAAVVARGMGRPCVCGVSKLNINEREEFFQINGVTVKYGDIITIDGGTGKVFLGETPLIQPVFSAEFSALLSWADERRDLQVRANAETPLDVITALQFGAEGLGLCRTEHMFFDSAKISLVQEMIVALDSDRRKEAVDRLLPMQIKDFKELFRLMQGKPINVRLLDPPLHEFLPRREEDKEELAKSLGLPLAVMEQRLKSLHEVNPMLGHRGCRLGITCPEIYQMQVQAIFQAINELKLKEGIDTNLELMIPLVCDVNELRQLKEYINEAIKQVNGKEDVCLGTMIELPRAALMAGQIAKEVRYFSFGTNDLTQTTYGISRDDIAAFLPEYLNKKIFAVDPFSTIDEDGVGELIRIAISRGRQANPGLKFGVCGEHAGNPESIEFFHKLQLDYISCSPYRLPIARIAAARAKIECG